MNSIENYENYLFVFAHPDDEVYTAGLMHRLIGAGKAVTAIFVTDGDAGANAQKRGSELAASMRKIGVASSHTVRLGCPEALVLDNMSELADDITRVAEALLPDCIVGMDYEGGHVGHDSASFLASRVAAKVNAVHYVFPVYHLEDGKRQAAQFMTGRDATDVITLTKAEPEVKKRVVAAHASQADHFNRLQEQDPTYFDRLNVREVYRHITAPYDFQNLPAPEIGYDRSGVTFDDFRRATSLAAN